MEMKTLKHMLTILVVTLAAFGNMSAPNVPTLTLNSGVPREEIWITIRISANLGYGNNGFGNFQDYTYNHIYSPAFQTVESIKKEGRYSLGYRPSV